MTAVQLALDLWPSTSGPGRHDTAGHQRGLCRVPWDTAGGNKAGDLIPAWVCCGCGNAEPTQYLLVINHACDARRPCCPPPGSRTYQQWAIVGSSA